MHARDSPLKKVACMFLVVAIAVSSIPGTTLAAQSQTSPPRTVWENPFTLTTYHQNNEVNSTFFTFPKVIWNGSQYVDYIFNSSDMSAGVGSVYLKVCPTHTVFYDPYRKEERIQSESWIAEYYNTSDLSWTTDLQVSCNVYSLVNSSGIYFDRKTTLVSGATLDVWYWLGIGSKLKISVVLIPALRGEHRLTWLLNGVSGTRVQWPTSTENITTKIVNDKSCSQIHYEGENESKCLVDWSDACLLNKTSGKWESCFQELRLERGNCIDRHQARITFGNFSLKDEESLILDPEIQTFNSDKSLDGYIFKDGRSYPPNDETDIVKNWTSLYVGQVFLPAYYWIYRSYLSFDTSLVPALAYNISAALKLRTKWIDPDTNFTVQAWGGDQVVYSGNVTILDGVQPIYDNNLTINSWGAGRVKIAEWDTTNYVNFTYINLTIPANQINKCNSTEFELNSSRDGISPPQSGKSECVAFYSGDSQDNEPKLEVSYCLDTVTVQGETWFYRNVSTAKVAIVIFGGPTGGPYSIDYTDEKEQGKIAFLDAIIQNGSSVFTPSHDPSHLEWSYYDENSTWVQDLTTWLVDNQSYRKVDLFGFSMGGAIVGYEIQKDYACMYSAAVISEAPVYMAGWGPIFNTALTASEAKVATSFMETPNATYTSYFYEMKLYYNNTIVQKEWHNWTGEHGELFRGLNCAGHTCSWSSGENISTAALMWFNTAHPLSAPFTPSGPQLGFAHNTFNYTTRGFQSDGGNLTYQFDWNDGTTTTVGPYVSGTNVTCSHCWTAVPTGQYHTYYNVTARVHDASQNWSANSTPLTVHIKLDDGGCGGDAGDTFGNASTYNSACSLGTLMTYPDYTDEEDWYKFQANSEDTIAMDETESDPFWVWLELYNPSGTLVAFSHNNVSGSQYISHTADTDGWWRARIFVYCNMGHLYTFHISVTGDGGGCPYVYDWNGSSYVKDNNILPASETGNGTDTKDSYKLEKPLVPLFGTRQASLYTLQIREFENEHDYIDQTKLLAVDHSLNTSIAVTSEGEIVTYANPAAPLSCVDNNGNNRVIEINMMDGNISDPTTYFQGYEGDWLVMDFGRVSAARSNLILRDDQKCEEVCINVQIPDGNNGWQTVEVLHPRDFWAMEAVNMSAYISTNSDFIIRLLWTAIHRLDYVGLDTSAQEQVQVYSAQPMLAIHSTLGNVTVNLLYDDENYVELVNGQRITLAFVLPNRVQGTNRDFIFCTDGYYYA
jgi:hypothetical protein